ncbi:DUF6214 family protein [Streptomyces sp. NPDC101225]|uniref:DUF6214 family protein n=1 Tax=Streptomyces sp. NPDC101225 TaxID=3366135 RepID=UPI0038307992
MSVWPAWEVREDERATTWFTVRLGFGDGARIDVLAVVGGGSVSLEEVRAQPPLSLDDLAELADWIEEPLFRACAPAPEPAAGRLAAVGSRRARPLWPRGIEGRRRVAQEYRTAQQQGTDPVLAVMCATGHSRRKTLRLISQARDSGFLTPRHARRRAAS